MLDPKKEYCLRAKIGEQWKTLVSAKLNDKGTPTVSFSPEFGTLLAEGRWVNTSVSVYDKREAAPVKPEYTAAPTYDDMNDEIPFAYLIACASALSMLGMQYLLGIQSLT